MGCWPGRCGRAESHIGKIVAAVAALLLLLVLFILSAALLISSGLTQQRQFQPTYSQRQRRHRSERKRHRLAVNQVLGEGILLMRRPGSLSTLPLLVGDN